MKGGIKQIIGFLVLILIFFMVLIVLLCSFNSDLMFCPMFEPFLEIVESLMFPR
jgi:hypothetical protein